MGTPAIAHFGTTIIEAGPGEGVDQKQIPITGALGKTLEFLRILGFQPAMENMYPGSADSTSGGAETSATSTTSSRTTLPPTARCRGPRRTAPEQAIRFSA